MIVLKKDELFAMDRSSSKGNQLKWRRDNTWYKADYLGYEGLSEYVVTKMLERSNLKTEEYVSYDIEKILYDEKSYNVSTSINFLKTSQNLFTLQRLYQQLMGQNLYESLFKIEGVENRTKFLVEQVERVTGIKDFGIYLSKLLTIDALFLNEDRHLHNIAVIYDEKRCYSLCPIFDNGASLLSDTMYDYPFNADVYKLMGNVKPKTTTFDSFEEQLEAVERLYGTHILFDIDKLYINRIIDEIDETLYSYEIKERVRKIMRSQYDKYRYLFK